MAEVETKRLSLRRGETGDFDAIHEIYAIPEVARMVGSWPIPADPERTMRVCAPVPVEKGIAGPILFEGKIIGNIGCLRGDDGQSFSLGYGLHPAFWGQGYGYEIADALVGAIFARYDAARIVAGVWADNPASARILTKLGMHRTHVGLGWCVGRQEVLDAHMYEISRADWIAAHPFGLETNRLTMRSYCADDVAALHRIVSDIEVARMVTAFDPNPTLGDVANWVTSRRYRGQAGFCAGVFEKGGAMVGNIGIAPNGVSTVYFYDRAVWGKGYATEAHRAFLDWVFRTYNFDTIAADHFADNPASGRVLAKLGFVQTATATGTSKARLEPAPVIEYRLTRTRFESMT